MRFGQKVRFTTNGSLGVMRAGTDKWIDGDYVRDGDEGTYIGPYPELADEDWHMISVGKDRFVPVARRMFAVAEGSGER
jgi:hypothetical protein